MKKLFKYLKKYKFIVFLSLLLLFVQVICELTLPSLMSNIVNTGIVNCDLDYIFKIGIAMIIVTLVACVSTIFVSFFSARVSAGTAMDLRELLFKKVESFSSNEIDKFSTASLITRTTNDITQVQNLIMMGIRLMCYAPIMGIGGIIMALSKSISMSWTIVLAIIILVGIIICIYILVTPKFDLLQRLTDKLNQISREDLNGMMVIRAFSNQKFEEKRFDNINKDLTKTSLFINRIMTFLMPAMMFIMNGTSILIVWVSSKQIAESNMQIGDMIAFIQYAMQIIISFLFIAMMFIMVPRAMVSMKRIDEVLNTDLYIKDSDNFKTLGKNPKGKIEFKNVSFKYEDAEDYVINNISFVAVPGKVTALIGPTGCGKSTLVNLIPRFYDVTSGEILIDDINIKDILQSELRGNIGYVPQKGILFSGDIKSNLSFGKKEIEDQELKKVAEISQSLEFINKKTNKFDSKISQGGSNVSGGQKQRLSIARALVKKACIYIFDDSFSALDYKTDAKLRSELRNNLRDSTILIVSQRISTIMNADQIIVLTEGSIVGKGTHSQLVKNCGIYKEIVDSQL